jgi:hypothetical protein
MKKNKYNNFINNIIEKIKNNKEEFLIIEINEMLQFRLFFDEKYIWNSGNFKYKCCVIIESSLKSITRQKYISTNDEEEYYKLLKETLENKLSTVEKRFKKEEMLHIKKYCLIASARKKILK